MFAGKPRFLASIAVSCIIGLLAKNRTAEAEENLALMEIMDRIFLSDPTLGALGMQDELAEKGVRYNVKRIRRLLRKMAMEPIYRHGPPRET